MSGFLDGKAALVTGGSRGIGAAIALRLAEEGASVAISYHSDSGTAEAVARSITDKTGRLTVAVQGDAGDAVAAVAVVDRVAELLGGLDVLVNNAGVLDPSFASIDEMDPAVASRVIDVNVRGPLLTSWAASRHLGEGGRIVNIGSCLGERVPGPGYVAYAASKAAITGLTRALARDLGPRGITVNEVAPGATDTDMNPQDGPNAAAQKELSPLGRFATPEEVAEAVAYFASPHAGFTTGARLGVDGGRNA
ncbi:SDR family oxidoreductase [Thermobifida halotolerans]|uniref:SDR family oxidoreductase n=1 Tax=Thermobifida halotolerans TaxID=483545 RepID=A0A399GA01_9ACTN|nr:SDR family oxidoreductase [Thermobifida halotolerans]UOE20738.1 SDR family oxidoreductase [Thermobifida halotolerans]